MFRGDDSKDGTLVIPVKGCTPAYAGPEVCCIMNKLKDGMTEDERDAVQKLHVIDQSCHDLYGSSLTVLEGLFGSRELAGGGGVIWSEGWQGPVVLEEYRGKFPLLSRHYLVYVLTYVGVARINLVVFSQHIFFNERCAFFL